MVERYGWRPRVQLIEGLSRTVDHFRAERVGVRRTVVANAAADSASQAAEREAA
jgi:hypothetical protein